MKTKFPAQAKALCCVCCLFYCLLVSYLDGNVIKRMLSVGILLCRMQRRCVAGSGLTRSGLTVLSALRAAVLVHLLRPLHGEQRSGAVCHSGRTHSPWKQSRSPLDNLLAFTACSCLFNGHSRTLLSLPTHTHTHKTQTFSALWITAAITSGETPGRVQTR